ncbi:MAG: HEPN domain-containing protein [Betaproteobacteria bacterium]
MTKAQRALASAHKLLQDKDGDGTCNRAYYAMFDAARAALIASKAPVPAEIAKTHSGLIAAFSLHLVKTGAFPIELGRALNRVEDLRLVADYKGDSISAEEAQWAVQQAQAFLEQVNQRFMGAEN